MRKTSRGFDIHWTTSSNKEERNAAEVALYPKKSKMGGVHQCDFSKLDFWLFCPDSEGLKKVMKYKKNGRKDTTNSWKKI